MLLFCLNQTQRGIRVVGYIQGEEMTRGCKKKKKRYIGDKQTTEKKSHSIEFTKIYFILN